MRTYETTILVPLKAVRANEAEALASVRSLYESEGASFIEFEKWEERRLAYPIEGETSALYLIGYFTADAGVIEKIERRVQLSDAILRHLIVKRDGNAYEAIRQQRAKALERAETAAAQQVED